MRKTDRTIVKTIERHLRSSVQWSLFYAVISHFIPWVFWLLLTFPDREHNYAFGGKEFGLESACKSYFCMNDHVLEEAIERKAIGSLVACYEPAKMSAELVAVFKLRAFEK